MLIIDEETGKKHYKYDYVSCKPDTSLVNVGKNPDEYDWEVSIDMAQLMQGLIERWQSDYISTLMSTEARSVLKERGIDSLKELALIDLVNATMEPELIPVISISSAITGKDPLEIVLAITDKVLNSTLGKRGMLAKPAIEKTKPKNDSLCITAKEIKEMQRREKLYE